MTHPDFPVFQGSPKEIPGPEQAMLKLSYGVHVVGSRATNGDLNAMLADWVMQVSFKPRLVAVSIENDARTLRYIRETGVFSVNLLHEKDGDVIARQVVMPADASKVKGRSEEASAQIIHKLANVAYGIHENGCAILDEALGWFTCDVRELHPVGDHTIVVGEVTDGAVVRPGEMLIERELGWEYAG
ncbi:MAG: flavin reductase family protein [Dehalococcoidia bacterium]|nr:flavin reductase family protein [Dehalococcoidia bacterium]